MRKAVINKSIGGFKLSSLAVKWLLEHRSLFVYDAGSLEEWNKEWSDISRFDSDLGDGVMGNTRDDGLITKDGRVYSYDGYSKSRFDPLLVQVVEEMGDKAAVEHCRLKVVEIPDDVEVELEDCDSGEEWFREVSRVYD